MDTRKYRVYKKINLQAMAFILLKHPHAFEDTGVLYVNL